MDIRMHFDIDIMGDGRNHFHFHGHGHIDFDYEEVILDPSILYYLLSHKVKENQMTYYLPDNMIRLIERSKEEMEYQEFLLSFLKYFGFGRKKENQNLKMFYKNIEKMKIKPISSEDIKGTQNDYYGKYLKMFSEHDFYVSMSPRMNFLGDYLAKILEFSKRTGKTILSKTRRLANLLREKIISLELPKRSDIAITAKSELINKIFDFQGGRATKFFIAIALSGGGFIHPAIGGIGLIFTFFDP